MGIVVSRNVKKLCPGRVGRREHRDARDRSWRHFPPWKGSKKKMKVEFFFGSWAPNSRLDLKNLGVIIFIMNHWRVFDDVWSRHRNTLQIPGSIDPILAAPRCYISMSRIEHLHLPCREAVVMGWYMTICSAPKNDRYWPSPCDPGQGVQNWPEPPEQVFLSGWFEYCCQGEITRR